MSDERHWFDIPWWERDGVETGADPTEVAFAPITDHIGTFVIEHGERDDSCACLCGRRHYALCPGPGIEGLTLRAAALPTKEDAP